ncbi:MAG: hypothetical protein ACK5LN_01340 [Propioniciclava sp.]
MSKLPAGWFPIPWAVSTEEAPGLAKALLAESGTVPLAGADVDVMVAALASAMARLPVTESIGARLWHGFGPSATGMIADLAVERRPPSSLDQAIGAGFPHVDLQRRVRHEDGTLATLAVVMHETSSEPAFLLRVQSPEAGAVRIVDVFHPDLRAIGVVWEDVAAIARG